MIHTKQLPWLTALGCCLYLSAVTNAQTTYLHCGQMIEVKTGTARGPVTMVVEGDKIARIENGYTAAPTGVTVVDLKNKNRVARTD